MREVAREERTQLPGGIVRRPTVEVSAMAGKYGPGVAVMGPIVGGHVRRGDRLHVHAGSTSEGTQLLVELAVAVATGRSWRGHHCATGRSLFVCLGHQRDRVMRRAHALCEEMGVGASAYQRMDVASVEATRANRLYFVHALLATFEPGDYDLVVVDPIGRVTDELGNAPRSTWDLCDALDRLAASLRCVVASATLQDAGSASTLLATTADAVVSSREPGFIQLAVRT